MSSLIFGKMVSKEGSSSSSTCSLGVKTFGSLSKGVNSGSLMPSFLSNSAIFGFGKDKFSSLSKGVNLGVSFKKKCRVSIKISTTNKILFIKIPLIFLKFSLKFVKNSLEI